MNFKIFQIPSVYTLWDGLSLITISRYCPFKAQIYPINKSRIHLVTQSLQVYVKVRLVPPTGYTCTISLPIIHRKPY
jgi:hypothetical protein